MGSPSPEKEFTPVYWDHGRTRSHSLLVTRTHSQLHFVSPSWGDSLKASSPAARLEPHPLSAHFSSSSSPGHVTSCCTPGPCPCAPPPPVHIPSCFAPTSDASPQLHGPSLPAAQVLRLILMHVAPGLAGDSVEYLPVELAAPEAKVVLGWPKKSIQFFH